MINVAQDVVTGKLNKHKLKGKKTDNYAEEAQRELRCGMVMWLQFSYFVKEFPSFCLCYIHKQLCNLHISNENCHFKTFSKIR